MSTARRPRGTARRDRPVGPLWLTAREAEEVKEAAARDGMATSAWAAQMVLGVVRQQIHVVPSDAHAALVELVRLRADLGAVLREMRVHGGTAGTAERVIATMRRIETAAETLAPRRPG